MSEDTDLTPSPASEPASASNGRQEETPPAPATPAEQPAPRRGGGCGRGCALVAVAIVGAIIGALVASAFVPWIAFDIPPWRLFDRDFIARSLGDTQRLSPTVRTIISGETTGEPAVVVAAKVSPSVVFISTREVRQDFFGSQTVEGEGSGVIYRSDGYIITNNHVVSKAQTIHVKIGDETAIPGKVVGTDPESDLAIVKVEKTGLPAAELGDSAKLTVGELAVVVGSPFGLEKTVTTGVISALHRNAVAQNEMGQVVTYANLIQTDAAVNPGNSGGALANGQGEVVGINTLIRSPSGASAGVGFAIPVNYVKSVAKQLMAGKKITHAYIGVVPAPVTPGSPHAAPGVTQGAYVSRVLADGPAEKAGIKEGDVIINVGGTKIATRDDLFAVVRQHQAGDKVKVTVLRGKQRLTVTVTLAARPGEVRAEAGPSQ